MVVETQLEPWNTLQVEEEGRLSTAFNAYKATWPFSSESSRLQRPDKKAPLPNKSYFKGIVQQFKRIAQQLVPSLATVPSPPESHVCLAQEKELLTAINWINNHLYQDGAKVTPECFTNEARLGVLSHYVAIQYCLWSDDHQEAYRVLLKARKETKWKNPQAEPSIVVQGARPVASSSRAAKGTKSRASAKVAIAVKKVSARGRTVVNNKRKSAGKIKTQLFPKDRKSKTPRTKKSTNQLRRNISRRALKIVARVGKRMRQDGDDLEGGGENMSPTKKAKNAPSDQVITTPRQPRKRGNMTTPASRNTIRAGVDDNVGDTDGFKHVVPQPKRKSNARRTIENAANAAWTQGQNELWTENPFVSSSNDAPSQTTSISNHPVLPSSAEELDARPLLPCRPPVWAYGRQAICESLPYFRATEAGCYFKGGLVKGYLLDGCPSERDMWASEGKVVVSHGGGHSERDAEGGLELTTDQEEEDARIRALLKTMHKKQPVVLLAGRKYRLFPWRIECDYIVLGAYLIIDYWVEAEGNPPVQRVKFKFQWLPCQGEPWWLTNDPIPEGWKPQVNDTKLLEAKRQEDAMETKNNQAIDKARGGPQQLISATILDDDAYMTPLEAQLSPLVPFDDCSSIGEQFQRMWRDRVMLVGKSLDAGLISMDEVFRLGEYDLQRYTFQEDLSQLSISHTSVELSSQEHTMPELLVVNARSSYQMNESTPFAAALELDKQNHQESARERQSVPLPAKMFPEINHDELIEMMGLIRPQIQSVQRFRGWECRECGETLTPAPARHDVLDLKGTVLPQGSPVSDLDYESVRQRPQYLTADERYVVTAFEIHDCESIIYHLRPKPHHPNEDPNDALFAKLEEEMQLHDLLHRFPARHSTIRGEMLSQHFLCNAGTHYKYITTTSTTPFEKGPPSMLEARKVVYEAACSVTPKDPQFNEMLTVAYMDEQHMAYHDDGEPGLGPVVASLSLGSPAVMSFRAKRKDNGDEEDSDDSESDEDEELDEDAEEELEEEVEETEDEEETEELEVVDEGDDSDDESDSLPELTELEDPADDDSSGSSSDNEMDEDESDEEVEPVQKKHRKPCLVLNLIHGDVVVMDGRKLHDMYVHKVEPTGFRFACTSRYIADVSKHVE
ncbi:hypothetical protein DACRYDRAFT_105197 [Dacryopinax primogenitus]|uniref:Alpha-ketoglutarate-dependent dioxygenase AlkB-like domain-containing protein n=1 Tax=Dacryopinax primogenitus (strain DJM 731) TaxID=1858805 RepID=M5G7H5_DACPD|nr:uncharacterized protein DACRYDRAFT_105197 [Dacryopinax primogenitus]EJU04130.1 hypothetical protein DACRYDRAFT_105197 [Dacryopinax primogenitus]